MIQFPIIQDKLFFEMTPLLPTTEYDDPSTSFHPYALARFSEIQGTGIQTEVYNFVELPETTDSEDYLQSDDLVAVSFDLNPGKGPLVTVVCNSGNRSQLFCDGKVVGDFPCIRKKGEDERGMYWYIQFTLTPEDLRKYWGIETLSGTPVIRANVFKTKTGAPHRHFGAIAPYVHAYELFSRENLQDLPVIRM